MLIKANEHIPLARLLQFIEQGEHLAQDCARRQATLAPNPGIQRFLKEQARQEAFHAKIFHNAIQWLAPRHLGPSPFTKPFIQYQQEIHSALERRNFYETILAEQVILEGLGEVTLSKLEQGLLKRQAPFQRLRRMFLQQEEAHHGFGNRLLERALQGKDVSTEHLQERAGHYLTLAEAMITTGQELLLAITEDPQWYLSAFYGTLPDWLRVQPCVDSV